MSRTPNQAEALPACADTGGEEMTLEQGQPRMEPTNTPEENREESLKWLADASSPENGYGFTPAAQKTWGDARRVLEARKARAEIGTKKK